MLMETLPLLRFDASDLIDRENIGSAAEVTNADDNDTEAEPPTYARELESFQLLPSENPETVEDNDEEFTKLLPILGWTVEASASNPRMQQDMRRFITTPASYIADF
ncbi:hypothetical protein V1525DRAFT_389221 [Lipomyces kononenkoae]|uniref:Uncharacterized protein n=1 Tax=Lipomyces kononenkoae TaxID=34357 RepID=A0ACC3SYD5_LIPKO